MGGMLSGLVRVMVTPSSGLPSGWNVTCPKIVKPCPSPIVVLVKPENTATQPSSPALGSSWNAGGYGLGLELGPVVGKSFGPSGPTQVSNVSEEQAILEFVHPAT